MNKKFKLTIPFAVLALSCGIAAGCDGCNKHEHEYSKWGTSQTQHWKECPEDGTKDEGTVANHGTPNAEGKCPDCGYQLVVHNHSYTEWGSSVTHHWKQCPDDGEIDASTKAVHGTPNAEGKCPDCSYQLVTYVDQRLKLVLRKDGANTPIDSVDGVTVTISQNGADLVEGTDYTVEKGGNGVLTIKKIVSGNYTVTVLTADEEYRYSDTVKMEAGEKEIVLQFNYAIATSQSYYVDLTHMNDTDRYLAINTSSVDGFWQWNEPVAGITLNLSDDIKNSNNVKLEFKLKAKKPNNQPNNAFGIVMTESYKGTALSIWDTEGETDGIKLQHVLGSKLGNDTYKADDAATLKWLEAAIYSENGADIRAVRTGNTITFFAKKDGNWVAFRSLACPENDKTDIKFTGAGSDYTITGIQIDANYTAAAQSCNATLTVLGKDGNKVTLADGAKGLLIAGDTRYEVELTKNADGTYAFSGNFVPGLYTLSILGKTNGYCSAVVQVDGEPTSEITLKYGDYANPTVYDPNKSDKIPLEDCITVNDGSIAIEGNKGHGFWQWGNGNTVPAATLNLSDEIKASRNVVVDFKLKATNPNNQPNNAFGLAMTEFHNGASLSFWDATKPEDGIVVHNLKGTWLGEDGWGDDKDGTLKWLETAIYGSGAYFRVERDGAEITFTARNGNEWVVIHTAECYEYADTMVKFMGIGSDYEISGIKVRVPKESDVSEFDVVANFAGDNSHGYKITVDPTVEEGDMATLVIETDNADLAWSYFPNAITVNGEQIDFSTVTVESLGANRVRYTLIIANIMENQNIVVAVAKGVKVDYNASVNNADAGSIICDMENYGKEYYWNDACTLTITAEDGYRLSSIVIGEGGNAQTVTEGWTKNGLVYTYTFTVTGDIKVNAVFEQTPEAALADVKINVVDKADEKVTLEENSKLVLNGDYHYELELTKNSDGTYSATGDVYVGEYVFSISGKHYGYGTATVTITEETTEITLKFGDIATVREEEINYDDHGMPYVNLNELVEVTDTDISINTAKIKGTKTDGFYRWNSSVPEASLTLSDQVKNATNVQLEFNLKVAGGNNDPNNAFGIALAGYKGVAVSLWNINDNKIDLHTLTGCKLGADGWGYADTYAAYGFVETLAESANGVNIRAIRNGASIKFFACNADGAWIKFFETSCAANAETDIKFLGMGSDYTVSEIKIALPQTALNVNAAVATEETGAIATDKQEYFVNEECTVTVTAAANYELKQLVIGDDTVTSGWTQNGNVYTYSFILAGDVNVVATLEKASVEVNLTITGEGLTDESVIKLTAKKDGTVTEFTKKEGVSQLIPGEYEVYVYGYKVTTLTVPADGGAVSAELEKTIAYGSSDEITVDDTAGTIAIKGNGAADRNGHRAISADLVLTEEQQNSENLTLTFNVKNTLQRRNGDDWAASRFGLQFGAGEIGFFVFLRTTNAADVVKLNPGSLDINPDSEKKWHGDDSSIKWINEAVYSADGLNVKVVRADGVIHIYAQNGTEWVQLDVDTQAAEAPSSGGDLTIGSTVKNDIKFLATGDDFTYSNIEVSTTVEGGSDVTE